MAPTQMNKSAVNGSRTCVVCLRQHAVRKCKEFQDMAIHERMSMVSMHRLCENCLSDTHLVSACTSQYLCQRCNEKHHTMLHATVTTVVRRSSSPMSDVLSIDDRSWAQQVEDAEREDVNSNRISWRCARRSSPDASTCRTIHRPSVRHQASSSRDEARRSPRRSVLSSRAKHNAFGRDWVKRDDRQNPISNVQRRLIVAQSAGTTPRSVCVTRHRIDPTSRSRLSSRDEVRLPHHAVAKTSSQRRHRPKRCTELRRHRDLRTALTSTSTSVVMQEMQTIAPTAMVSLMTRKKNHQIRILLSPGRTQSAISEEFVRRFDLNVDTVNGQRVCRVRLRSLLEDRSELHVYAIVEKIVPRTTPARHMDPRVMTPYNHLKLADPKCWQPHQLAMILGCEATSRLNVSGAPSITGGSLHAQSTIFGWVLSGVCAL